MATSSDSESGDSDNPSRNPIRAARACPERSRRVSKRTRPGRDCEAAAQSEAPLLLNRQRAVRADGDKVREFLRLLHSQLSHASFSVCLLSDRAIRRYNRQYRDHDEPSDVLSFPAGAPEANGSNYLGDILISAETAHRNARRWGLRLDEEIEILALHGLLHLMGYDHENDGGQMARREKHWRKRFGLPASLTERSRAGRARRGGNLQQSW